MTIQEAFATLAAAQVAYNQALTAEATCKLAYDAAKPTRPAAHYTQDPAAFHEYFRHDNDASRKTGFDDAILVRLNAERTLLDAMRALLDMHPVLARHYERHHYTAIRPLYVPALLNQKSQNRLARFCASLPVPQHLEVRAC